MNPEILWKYFPNLTDLQREQFSHLGVIFSEINAQVNLISRKDMEGFYERHVLHSLAIAKYTTFVPGTRIMDLGTGGGFPGIPLAIMFPHVEFVLVDSIRKKVTAAQQIAERLELKNATFSWSRAEEISGSFDFIVSRAVAPLNVLIMWIEKKVAHKDKNPITNGLITLKGGELRDEVHQASKPTTIVNIHQWFVEPFFETKALLHTAL